MLTGEQIRAARALLRWDQKGLAETSGVSLPTIKRLEAIKGKVSAYTGTVDKIQRALETAGVEFENDDAPGVRLRSRAT